MNECPSPQELTKYVAGECDAASSERIERHLERCARCTDWCLSRDADDALMSDVRRVLDAGRSSASGDSDAHEATGENHPDLSASVEGFRIQRELGRGGMGAVYLAEQLSTKRTVALKILLEGPFASDVAKRRFEREVELAAQLDHPNVVTVLESGVSQGRHYFAMRYVPGLEWDEYVQVRKPDRRAFLKSFAVVCRAISYAHQRGVLHRDLKPSNVIVGEDGTPYVLDFGLARVADARLDRERADRLLSMPGQPIGTLPYMSPEQTTGLQHELDVRTDVYSLGLIAYRLLTGRHPYRVTGDVYEVMRQIKEVEPTRPSTVRSDLDGELDTILLKALAKDRDRRYQSADALAEDVERYLTGRAILARRDSVLYVLRKRIARHRIAVAAVVVFVALVVASGVAMVRKRNAEIRAESAGLLTALVSEPAEAVALVADASEAVTRTAVRAIQARAASDAFTDRVVAGRGGLLLDRDAFWHSVDGGPLWRHGEWLELCDAPELVTPRVFEDLRDVALSGTDRQKYVALCLIGCLAGSADTNAASLCGRRAAEESHPGVAMAAAWAARRFGPAEVATTSAALFDDPVAGMRFARIPPVERFFRGSDHTDRYRYEDELRPEEPVAINDIFVATTEVPHRLFRRFLQATAPESNYASSWLSRAALYERSAGADRAGDLAAGLVTLNVARRFCSWLNVEAATAAPDRTYRLPTEGEWEYAARGGSTSRFCFGDDPKYADRFAACRGQPNWPVVAQRMPNWYGLFDMHGSLWEWTSSRYPAHLAVAAGMEEGRYFVYRGGAFPSPPVRCRSAQRNFASEDAIYDYTGIRLVMELASD